jgi:tetratricopeptide (TPR) repeat protein
MRKPGENRLLSAGKVLTFFFILYVVLISLTKVNDPDAWVHLSLGRLLLEAGGFPAKEMFSYPSFEMPFSPSYPFWVFSVVLFLVYEFAGAGGIVVLKAAIVAAAFLLLLKDSLKPHRNHVVAVLVLAGAVIISQYRFVVRPDILLMAFIAFSVFSLNSYLYENRKYIYALPIVNVLWANSHSSISIMFVPFLAFIVGGLLQQHLETRGMSFSKTPTASQIKVIAIVFAASFISSLLNPHFIEPYLFAYKTVSVTSYKEQIVELIAPSGSSLINLYVYTALILASFLLARNRFSLIHLLIVIPFLVLPFTAARFQFLIGLVGGPVLARNISAAIDARELSGIFRSKAALVAALALVTASCVLGLMRVEPFGSKGTQFGLGFDYAYMPRGAVQYMDKKDIKGRVFNTFHFGQYIIWESYPERTVFVDGRAYLPNDMFETYLNARYSYEIIDSLQDKYGFEAVLLGRPKLPPKDARGHRKVDMGFEHPDWALVYWDDKSYLYLRRGGTYASIIKEDEYRYVKPLTPFASFIRGLNDDNMPGFEQELKRNTRETKSSSGHMFLSLLYLTAKNYQKAIEEASKAIAPGHIATSYIAMGDAYKGLGNFELSLHYYKKALSHNEIPGVHLRAGTVSQIMGDNKQAIRHFERAIELDSSMAVAYPKLIDAYLARGMEKEANEAMRKYKSLNRGH